jgi:hypothetical protein
MLGQRREHRETETRRLFCNSQLGYIALAVGVVLDHEHMFADKTSPVNTSTVKHLYPVSMGLRGALLGVLVLVHVEDQALVRGAADVEVEGGALFELAQ